MVALGCAMGDDYCSGRQEQLSKTLTAIWCILVEREFFDAHWNK